MPRYNGLVFPRGFTIEVEAEDEHEAYEKIEEYVIWYCNCHLIRDDEYAENLLDEGVDIADIYEVKKNDS